MQNVNELKSKLYFLIYLKTKIHYDIKCRNTDEGNSQYSLVCPPYRVLHHGRDGVLGLLHPIHHVSHLCVPEDVWPGPGHLRALMRPGQNCPRWSTLTHSWLACEYEGDTLGHHSSWAEEAEEDTDGGEEVADDELECHVETIAEVVGGEDTEGITLGYV